MTAFLWLGLALTGWLMARVDQPYAYWLVLRFIFRAIAQQGRTVAGAVKFGTGAVLGSIIALALSALSLPVAITVALSCVLAMLGLRYLPHPYPWSAMAFTSAVLLSLAPGQTNALFRLEAALTVVFLTVILVALIGGSWQLLTRWSDASQA